MNTAKCYTLKGDFGRIAAHINLDRDNTIYNEIAIFSETTDIRPNMDGHVIVSVSDRVDKIVEQYGGEIEREAIREQLRQNPSRYSFVYGNETLSQQLEYIIVVPGGGCPLHGLKETNLFQAYNIDDNIIEETTPGLYVFCTAKFEDNAKTPRWIFTSFSYVSHKNYEAIKEAQSKGAMYFFVYPNSNKHRCFEIAKDLKAGESYRSQLMDYPEVEEGAIKDWP
jgi:hypothetical protein